MRAFSVRWPVRLSGTGKCHKGGSLFSKVPFGSRLAITELLSDKDAGMQSLAEPWADTASPAGRMVLTVFSGIAEFERTLILSRTDDVRRAATARGVAFGRPRKMRPDQQEVACDLIRDGKSVSEVARTFNVHPATIYRCIEAQ